MAMDLEEWSTWSAGMAFFGHLHATEKVTNEYWRAYYRRLKAHDAGAMPPQKYLETFPELRKLGDRAKIERFIVKILEEVKDANGGLLPKFRELPVTGSDQPLLIPEGCLSASDVADIEEAALGGVTTFENMMRKIDGLNLSPEDVETAATSARDEFNDYTAALQALDDQLEDGANEATTITLNIGEEDEREVNVPAMTAAARQGVLAKVAAGEEVTGGAQALAITRQVAGYAVFLGSVSDCVQSFADIDGSQSALGLATDILDGVAAAATVCASLAFAIAGLVASISSALSWVGVILTILAYLCAFVVWIIGLFDHAYGSLLELGYKGGGSHQSWDNPACIRVLGERLRVICQAEPDILTPQAIIAFTETQMSHSGDTPSGEARKAVLHWCLQALSLRPEDAEGSDPDLHANAVTIARNIGRVVDPSHQWCEAAKLCDDIRQWMLYAGADPDEVAVIYQWLYEAHKVTVVNDRQQELAALPASARCQDGPSKPNSCILMGTHKLDQGSASYFAESRNLPYNEWLPFYLDDLRSIHEMLRGHLVSRGVNLGRVNAWSIRQIMQAASYCNPSTAIWGSANDALIPDWIMPVGDYTVLVYPGMSSSRVRPEFRDAYFSVTISGQFFGCIAVVRDLWDRGFIADGVEPVYGEVPRRDGPECVTDLQTRLGGCGPDLPWPARDITPAGPARPYATAILCVAKQVEIPVRYEEAPRGRLANTTYREHQRTINSAEFKDAVALLIAEEFGISASGSGSKALGVLAGLAAAAGLGFVAYKAI